MTRSCRRAVIEAFVVVAVLGLAPMAVAETKTYCDNKCGDTQACKYICCHITTKTVEGVELVTNVSCSTSTCSAFNCGDAGALRGGGRFTIPTATIEGVSGPVKKGLTEVDGLDASAISVEADDRTRTVTLSGTLASAAQREGAVAIARKRASGYKVVDRLTIAAAAGRKK